MAKTYTLTSTDMKGGNRSGWNSGYWGAYSLFANTGARQLIGGDPSTYFATYIKFNSSTLATLRTKTVTSVKLTFTVKNGIIPSNGTESYAIGLAANSLAGTTSQNDAWQRKSVNDAPSIVGRLCNQTPGGGSISASNTQLTIDVTSAGVPEYGYVIGPNSSSIRSYVELVTSGTATLTVVTNETDYSYTLAYNANSGSNAPTSQTGSNTGTSPSYTFTITSAQPTRTGYTFSKWNTKANGTGTNYNPGGSITVTSAGTTTLYAQWTINTYTVSYNVNGGSGTFANQTKNYGGSFTIHSTKPTKASASAGSYTVTYNGNGGNPGAASQSAARTTSYTFSVWNTAQNGSGTSYAAGGTYSANASATLYAQYTSSTTAASVSLTSASRTGYTFNGWYTAASGGTRVGGSGSAYTPTGNVTLYAQWTASSATLSSVTPSPVVCGNNLTGSWTSTGASYKYRLKVTCGNAAAEWSSLTAANASSASVQIPTSWYSMANGPLKNAVSATATCELYTYASDGTTQIGVASSKTFTVQVPSNIAPTLSSLTCSSSSTNSVVSGWGSNVFVQGYSKVTLTLSVSSYNGSALSSVRFSGPGLDSTGTSLTSPASSVVNSSGSVRYYAYCTDTRGRTSSTYVDVPFQAYSYPTVTGIAVSRCDSDGTVNNASGAYFKATPSYSFSAVGSNSLRVQTIQYRVHPSGAWSTATTCTSGSTYGPWSAVLTNTYDVNVTLADSIQEAAGTGTYTMYAATLPTVQGLWFGKGNDRIGLGGVPDGPGLYCDWNATFRGVVDVTPRRTSAYLSTPGWYRVLTFVSSSASTIVGAFGIQIDFVINRSFWTINNEMHRVTLSLIYNGAKFVDELSCSNYFGITKIRYNANTVGDIRFGYVDIYYNLTSSNPVYVDFTVHQAAEIIQSSITASGLPGVAPSPANETIVTTHDFIATGHNFTMPIYMNGTLIHS